MQQVPIKRLYYSASEICSMIGIQFHELKKWEDTFPNLHPARSKGGRRLYKPKDLDLLNKIKKLKDKDCPDEKIIYILEKGIPETIAQSRSDPYTTFERKKILGEIENGLKDILDYLKPSS